MSNVSPTVAAPTLWNYAICGQYPGAVAAAATVDLKCTCNTAVNHLYATPVSLAPCLQCTCNLPAYRYVIVQFPSSPDSYANFCELVVYVSRKFI